MAKKVDPLKAKAAKQRKLATGLCVLFAAVLAFQVPRTLKMLEGPARPHPAQAAAAGSAPAATPVVSGTSAATPGTPGTSVPPTGEAEAAVLTDTDLPPVPAAGQLLSFEKFASKDPFTQQAVATRAPEATPAEAPKAEPTTSAKPTDSAVAGSGSTPVPEAGATPAQPTAPTPAAPVPTAPSGTPAAATLIVVNGVEESVATDATFPVATPTFVLTSLAADGKSAQIAIAGGTYADGRNQLRLTIGKPLTLRNTADGTRFELELRAVQGYVPPAVKQKK